jgi:2-dehydro-3-deoxygluconokinase
MSEVVTMGEMMIRFMPPNNLRFEQATGFDIYYGGDESIVAVSLARFGVDTAYVTKLPDNVFGQMALNYLRMQGVNTDYITHGGERLGLNFYENGAAVRPPRVIYDRAHSAIAEAVEADFDFNNIFKNVKWFHISGITPAISKTMAKITAKAMRTAKESGLTVSFDFNYRKKLWTIEEAQIVLSDLMQYTDIFIGSKSDAELMLGYRPQDIDFDFNPVNPEDMVAVYSKLKDKYHLKLIASTLRESHSASDNGWSALIYDGTKMYTSRKYEIHLIDRGGGGAAFSGGLIFGLVTGKKLPETLEFATAASALKQTITGDFNLVTKDEVIELAAGNLTGKVQR